MSKKRNRVVLLFAMFIATTGYFIHGVYGFSKDQEGRLKSTEAFSDSNIDSETRKESKNKWNRRQDDLMAFKTLALNSRQIPQDEEEMDNENQRSDEEKEYINQLHEITAPYYWDMAPSVLREIHKQERHEESWQTKIEQAAEDDVMIEESEKGNIVSNIDCRETLCLIEFEHPDKETYEKFLESDMQNEPWMSASGDAFGGFREREDGKLESYIYFSREGDMDAFIGMRKKMAEKVLAMVD